MKYYLILVLSLAILYSCKQNPVSTNNNTNSNYKKVFTTGTGDSRFEIYSSSSDSLVSGYNEIGFKVFQNSQEMKTGFVKFSPRMHHPPPVTGFHSTPISSQFNYDNDKQLFTGYISFIMVSDPLSTWYGFYNYNDQFSIDSISFRVILNPSSQMKYFVDDYSQTNFWLTLAAPLSPSQGPNVFKCLLHKTVDDVYYTEVDSAQMIIFPWMSLMGHSSSNNVMPVYSGGGIYTGNVNLNMSGEWFVYDTIHYQNRVITPQNNPPKFILESP